MPVVQQSRFDIEVREAARDLRAVFSSDGPGDKIAAAGLRRKIMKAVIQVESLQIGSDSLPNRARRL